MPKSAVIDLWLDFLSLFFPNECLACSSARVKGEDIVCTRCLLELPQSGYHLESENPLWRRLSYRIPLNQAVALFRFAKNSRVQRLLHALKYRNHPEVGVALGRYYGTLLREGRFFHDVDLIIPVPLHPARMRARGYNQSVQFASGLSDVSGVPFSDTVLARTQRTETQTAKSKLDRWESMRGVFRLTGSPALGDKHVVLVDDVITTGATVESCVAALLKASPRQISLVCIAEA